MILQETEIVEHGKSNGRYYYKETEYGSKNYVDDPESVIVVMSNPNPAREERRLYFHEFDREHLNNDKISGLLDLAKTGIKISGTFSDSTVSVRNFFDQTDLPGRYKVSTSGVRNQHSLKAWNVRERVDELLTGSRRYYLVRHEYDIVYQVTRPQEITVETVDGREMPITSYRSTRDPGRQAERQRNRRQTGRSRTSERHFPDPDDPDLEDKLL